MLSLMVSASQAQSEVVHRTIPDPAEQAPLLVARSVTPPSPPSPSETMEREGGRHCFSAASTSNQSSILCQGGRDDRGVP